MRADKVTLGRPAFPRKKPRLDGWGPLPRPRWCQEIGLAGIGRGSESDFATGQLPGSAAYVRSGPEAERLKTSTSRPLCTRKRTFDDQGSSPIDGVAVVLELPQEFGFPGAAIIHFGKGDTSKVGTCLTCASPLLI